MTSEKKACTARVCEVTEADMPLCCPMPDMEIWNAHPRVYLPIESLPEVTCPYCETRYVKKIAQ